MWSLIRQHQFVSGTQCVLLSKQENIKVPLFDSETPPIQDQSDSENVGGKAFRNLEVLNILPSHTSLSESYLANGDY
ncbi:hypothetical protein L3X38_004732 [Prunus dulcis]|uniref:Uncharacterized protein n=1 Tax=Prunus dulcis TaxID=3755 RepID=A0AAD5F3D3_PRUDU|nr:hypothetical protein L3X38_004732 [Prunus dulcis]